MIKHATNNFNLSDKIHMQIPSKYQHSQPYHKFVSFFVPDQFLNAYDLEVLRSLPKSIHSAKELFRISFPCLLSLALCPMTLYMYQPLVDTFWFNLDPDLLVLPNVNEAILCFLMPAGVVYATSFGFAIDTAVAKQSK